MVPSKNKKAIPPELDERQQRASACEVELGVLHCSRWPLMGSVAALLVTSYGQPVTRHQMAGSIMFSGGFNRIWSPPADDPEFLQNVEKEQKERMQEKGNEKKLKKKQLNY